VLGDRAATLQVILGAVIWVPGDVVPVILGPLVWGASDLAARDVGC
jgi:hypothetical protein